MRKLCPNFENENGLETVLEVPIPEDMWTNIGSSGSNRWQNLRALMKAQISSSDRKLSRLSATSDNEFIALLKLVGCPLIPLQVQSHRTLTRPLQDSSIEDSTAKYIVQQYIAATGGYGALDSLKSMYAVGQVRMFGSDMSQGNDSVQNIGRAEVGGFVLWQKNPDLWHFELVVSGFKVSAGSDGKVAWNQSSCQPCHANKGPPRPLRRFFQGLDPRCTANLFQEAVWVGEKTINNEDCFLLKLDTTQQVLETQSTSNTEIIRHTTWGYFSQRTGLLIKFQDTKLVKMKPVKGKDHSFWETSIESMIEDYRYIDGINIAHGGTTIAMLYRYGNAHNHKRRIEETWRIEEVDFNICGLSMDCFLPPSDLKREQDIADCRGSCAEEKS
ncbi:hypothetical protein TanjilG_24441 [Lupinus angustifolius]|uniref:DUF620 family protein n=1 Tax=Lupinus angustifolius TaxID=3871 RepID=A0A1J7IGW2_LUPAN|nr:PREDICTED: uncharacterized protein LOC109347159 [Lupinus angustifolius]OIW12043.1 hypothetical protein TanjilG_24441 [Lupinus angustifolius]